MSNKNMSKFKVGDIVKVKDGWENISCKYGHWTGIQLELEIKNSTYFTISKMSSNWIQLEWKCPITGKNRSNAYDPDHFELVSKKEESSIFSRPIKSMHTFDFSEIEKRVCSKYTDNLDALAYIYGTKDFMDQANHSIKFDKLSQQTKSKNKMSQNTGYEKIECFNGTKLSSFDEEGVFNLIRKEKALIDSLDDVKETKAAQNKIAKAQGNIASLIRYADKTFN